MQTVKTLSKMKKNNKKITMITAYDYPSAKIAEQAEVDTILVGDSLGMVVLGYENTLQVTIDDMIHHTKAVRRGAPNTFIIVDMPYGSYHINLDKTKENAIKLITETRANAVKLEGGNKSRLEAIKAITDCEIPVVAHLGLTPQSVNKFGGYNVQGKNRDDFTKILKQAQLIEEAGAFLLVLEGIPEALGKEISELISIPTVGIGAGRFCNGQVLVYHDVLGMSDFYPKFVKKYAEISDLSVTAIKNFVKDIKDGNFPAKENVYNPID